MTFFFILLDHVNRIYKPILRKGVGVRQTHTCICRYFIYVVQIPAYAGMTAILRIVILPHELKI